MLCALPSGEPRCSLLSALGIQDLYLEKIRVFKAGISLNTLAWNNGIGPWCYFVGYGTGVMINRDSWGRSYFVVRGEILGLTKD